MKESLLFSLDGRTELAEAIVEAANDLCAPRILDFDGSGRVELGKIRTQKFSDGELCPDFTDSVRGKRVYLLTSPKTSDEIIILLLAIDAAKRASAKEIVVILPYFPYARQDKKDQSRGPIGAKVMAEMIEQRGATSVITFDLHADQIQGFFNIPVTHIEGKNVFDSYIKDICTVDTVLCGPDAGSGKRIKRMRDQLTKRHDINLNYVMMDKTRKEANRIEEMTIIGDVKGKDVIILDDMVDTAGTLSKAADVLMSAGAKSVIAVISHGVLSGHAYEHIGESSLKSLVVSDSLPLQDPRKICSKEFKETQCINIMKGASKIRAFTIAKQIGLAMAALNNDKSYEALLSNKKATA